MGACSSIYPLATYRVFFRRMPFSSDSILLFRFFSSATAMKVSSLMVLIIGHGDIINHPALLVLEMERFLADGTAAKDALQEQKSDIQ